MAVSQGNRSDPLWRGTSARKAKPSSTNTHGSAVEIWTEAQRPVGAKASLTVIAGPGALVLVRRHPDPRRWIPEVYRDRDSFDLPCLTRPIAVDEVYDDILDGAGRSLLR